MVNDPAGRDGLQVRNVYCRDEFVRAWACSGGVVYLVYPNGWSPADPAYARGSW